MKKTSSKTTSPKNKVTFPRIFLLISIAVIGGMFFVDIRDSRRSKASANWPTTEGTVVKSSVERIIRSGSKGQEIVTYQTKILYEYTVDNSNFKGHRITYVNYEYKKSLPVQQIINQYPEGKLVTVYYMPGAEQESVLEPRQ